MSTWSNTRTNYLHTWNLVGAPSLSVVAGSAAEDVVVTPQHARGLVDGEDYNGSLPSGESEIGIVFRLSAAGLVGGKKQLAFASAVQGAQTVSYQGAPGTSSQWGSSLSDFAGAWALAGGGDITIENGAQVQCSGVPGLADLVFQGTFDAAAKEIRITFGLANNGYTGGDSNQPREVLFLFPEVLHTSTGTPTEGERYEEAGSGGGG